MSERLQEINKILESAKNIPAGELKPITVLKMVELGIEKSKLEEKLKDSEQKFARFNQGWLLTSHTLDTERKKLLDKYSGVPKCYNCPRQANRAIGDIIICEECVLAHAKRVEEDKY